MTYLEALKLVVEDNTKVLLRADWLEFKKYLSVTNTKVIFSYTEDNIKATDILANDWLVVQLNQLY